MYALTLCLGQGVISTLCLHLQILFLCMVSMNVYCSLKTNAVRLIELWIYLGEAVLTFAFSEVVNRQTLQFWQKSLYSAFGRRCGN